MILFLATLFLANPAAANAVHAFTNPHNVPPNSMPGKSEYNPIADQRSWASLQDFLREWFR